jgi:hypothetical protein
VITDALCVGCDRSTTCRLLGSRTNRIQPYLAQHLAANCLTGPIASMKNVYASFRNPHHILIGPLAHTITLRRQTSSRKMISNKRVLAALIMKSKSIMRGLVQNTALVCNPSKTHRLFWESGREVYPGSSLTGLHWQLEEWRAVRDPQNCLNALVMAGTNSYPTRFAAAVSFRSVECMRFIRRRLQSAPNWSASRVWPPPAPFPWSDP